MGYGDMTPVTTSEKVSCIFIMFIGVCVYSLMIGNITSCFIKNDSNSQIIQQRSSILDAINKEFKLKKGLYRAIRKTNHFGHKKERLKDEEKLIEYLPFHLRNELENIRYNSLVKDILIL